jgi:hypothetical protein
MVIMSSYNFLAACADLIDGSCVALRQILGSDAAFVTNNLITVDASPAFSLSKNSTKPAATPAAKEATPLSSA